MRAAIITYGGVGYPDLKVLPWREYEAATDIAVRLNGEKNGD